MKNTWREWFSSGLYIFRFCGTNITESGKDRDGNDKLKYVFTPGPYTKLLKKAQNDPGNYYYLVIEELNRGNAPAIFGEVFQLLDRKDEEDFPLEEVGESEYGISNYEVAKEVYGDEKHQVRIPSNMYVLATMNTADQNVFTLDTAFQRRWNMRQIENNFDKSEHSKDIIAGTKVSWGAFATVINDMVIDINVDMASSEDKRLGTYFARKKELEAGRFSERYLNIYGMMLLKWTRQLYLMKIVSLLKMWLLHMRLQHQINWQRY